MILSTLIYGRAILNIHKIPAGIDLKDLPALPLDDDGPVFAEPWQAQAFAMVLELTEAGRFSWAEWASALGRELQDAAAAGNPDDGSRYYYHWVAALENLVQRKELAAKEQLEQRKEDWGKAFRNTPHGKPVVLE